jgi:hypothetical protein
MPSGGIYAMRCHPVAFMPCDAIRWHLCHAMPPMPPMPLVTKPSEAKVRTRTKFMQINENHQDTVHINLKLWKLSPGFNRFLTPEQVYSIERATPI